MPLNDLLLVAVAAQAVTAAVPLVAAGLGELAAERAGVINVGIEGLMLAGCIGGFAGAVLAGTAWVGLLAAVAAGMALALLFALATVLGRADQIVAGMAINLLAVGGSGAAWVALQAHGLAELPAAAGFARAPLGQAAGGLPLLGPLLFDQYAALWVVAALAAAAWWALRATRAGLVLCALGEAPDACAAAGVRVLRWRVLVLVAAGALAGLAGAYLSIMRTHGFTPLMTGGMGFVVLALVIFGRWRVGGLVAGCLGFGAIDSLQQQFQGSGLNEVVPYQVFKALPYLVALAALALLSRGGGGPAALGRPWPGER